jgi:hypothetical protein
MTFTGVPMAPDPDDFVMPVTWPAVVSDCACTQITRTSPEVRRVALAVVRPVAPAVANVPTAVRVVAEADAVPAIPTESTVVVMRAIAA